MQQDSKCLWKKEHLIVIFAIITVCESKLVKGVWESLAAQQFKGQYVASFCFHGENAVMQYRLSSAGVESPKLYFYLDEDWRKTMLEDNCAKRLNMARITHEIKETTGNQTPAFYKEPRVWHIVFADSLSCQPAIHVESQYNHIEFELWLLNEDSLGNPQNQFSHEESGVYRFYQLLTLAYFVASCIVGPQLIESLRQEGPMVPVLKLLTGATALQSVAALTITLHLRTYSKNGMGVPILAALAEVLAVTSQLLVVYMLLSISLGWSLLGTLTPRQLITRLAKNTAGTLLLLASVFQVLLVLWQAYDAQTHRMHYAPCSVWVAVVASVHTAVAVLFSRHLYSLASAERSKLKRDFYFHFTLCCLAWFLAHPMSLIASWLFTSYLRFKIVTIGGTTCQVVCLVLMFRLLLARSLFWEISTLGSTLPVRMDKTFGRKLYS